MTSQSIFTWQGVSALPEGGRFAAAGVLGTEGPADGALPHTAALRLLLLYAVRAPPLANAPPRCARYLHMARTRVLRMQLMARACSC